MTQTVWAHLPNAKHIDWVLASLKVHPKKWTAAWNAAFDAARDAARDAAYYAAWNTAYVAGRHTAFDAAYNAGRDASQSTAKAAAWDAAYYAAWNAATDTIIALIAYDDCAYMIESEVGELKIIAAFGNQPAILLLPACIVFNETKVLV